ncbi:unnamed protein product [Vitrella brassicaformis CCMP3155]|uniref:F-box domain-containing protein n=1 Tax=Vitrella brassicaformis (strain CCMP3155) TaxID=1169540 RepID=A0A0G4GR10_VITBC|nr:unnamed protein product [Vitrella brassicaformis CCMP3155]|eukprot:CEM32781.1 unnamed protein product [Vitrella brassicaformis CCMP3155]
MFLICRVLPSALVFRLSGVCKEFHRICCRVTHVMKLVIAGNERPIKATLTSGNLIALTGSYHYFADAWGGNARSRGLIRRLIEGSRVSQLVIAGHLIRSEVTGLLRRFTARVAGQEPDHSLTQLRCAARCIPFVMSHIKDSNAAASMSSLKWVRMEGRLARGQLEIMARNLPTLQGIRASYSEDLIEDNVLRLFPSLTHLEIDVLPLWALRFICTGPSTTRAAELLTFVGFQTMLTATTATFLRDMPQPRRLSRVTKVSFVRVDARGQVLRILAGFLPSLEHLTWCRVDAVPDDESDEDELPHKRRRTTEHPQPSVASASASASPGGRRSAPVAAAVEGPMIRRLHLWLDFATSCCTVAEALRSVSRHPLLQGVELLRVGGSWHHKGAEVLPAVPCRQQETVTLGKRGRQEGTSSSSAAGEPSAPCGLCTIGPLQQLAYLKGVVFDMPCLGGAAAAAWRARVRGQLPAVSAVRYKDSYALRQNRPA